MPTGEPLRTDAAVLDEPTEQPARRFPLRALGEGRGGETRRRRSPASAAHRDARSGPPGTGPDPSESACRALYERYQACVYRVCLRATGNASDALDASQETFVRVFANLARQGGRARLAGWIATIAVNASRDVRRKKRRDTVSLELLLEARECRASFRDEHVLAPEVACARHELAEAVGHPLDRLSPPLRRTVRLRYEQGLAYGEIARALAVPIGTIKSRLARAHAALQPTLGPKLARHELG